MEHVLEVVESLGGFHNPTLTSTKLGSCFLQKLHFVDFFAKQIVKRYKKLVGQCMNGLLWRALPCRQILLCNAAN